MVRIARWTRVKAGCEAEYTEWHRKVWPELLALNSRAGIRNYSIYLRGRELFSYLEVDDWDAAMQFLGGQEVAQKWQELMAPLMDASDVLAPWERLEEVFHLD
jgi:L-rhamnose mutarotase